MTEPTPANELPLRPVSAAAADAGMFPDGDPTDETPLGAAYLWFVAVQNLDIPEAREDVRVLSYNPKDWGDYRSVARGLKGWSLMQNIEYPDGDATIAYARLLHIGYPAQAYGDAPIAPKDLQYLTLVAVDGRRWRVWGISPGDYRPPPSHVNGTEI